MTPTVVLAAVAGALAAVGLGDVIAGLITRVRAQQSGRSSRALRWAALATDLGHRIGAPAPPGNLAARLAAAGVGPTIGTGDAMAAKAGSAVLAALAAAPLAATLPLRLGALSLAGAAVGGFLAPDLWLARRARQRASRASLELADVLDLLAVAVEAGLGPGRALAEVGAQRGGLVAEELRAVAARVELGVPSAEALATLARRLPLGSVRALVAAVERADRHGAPLAHALMGLAEEARTERARRLQERAAAAAPRIQLAIALLLVPAVLLLVAAGLVHSMA
jgi:tight adherence protein C